MSNIITARDIEIVTGEIRYVQRRAARQLLSDLIEIGRLLVEAKSMVPYGEWGKYLEERVEYSTSQANNLMRLYKEYGDNQESFFTSLQHSQTFGNLTYTQALALVALPPEDRAEFAEKHDVEHMSTRELEKAIREELAAAQQERDELRQENAGLTAQLDAAGEKILEAERQTHAQQNAAQMARDEVNRLNGELETARKQSDRSAKEAVKLQKELDSAKESEKKIQDQLEQLKTNPKIPAAMMEQLRLEVEQEAARKATHELQKQLNEAVAGRSAAEEKAKHLEQQLSDAQRTAKIANPVITETIVRAQKLQNDFNELNGLRLKQLAQDTPDSVKTAGAIRKIMADMVEQMLKLVKA